MCLAAQSSMSHTLLYFGQDLLCSFFACVRTSASAPFHFFPSRTWQNPCLIHYLPLRLSFHSLHILAAPSKSILAVLIHAWDTHLLNNFEKYVSI